MKKMKHAKKLASLLMALVMVLGMSVGTTVTAFADDTYSITINNSTEGHTYEAYQIFTGDLHEGVLSNIEWGSSVSNSAALTDAAAVAKKLDPSYTGEDKITVDALLGMVTLGNPVANSGKTEKPYVISSLAAGYYLVKDKDGSVTGEGDAYTEYIVKVVGNVTTEPKSDVSRVEKKVKDTNDSTGETSGWQDSADYDIGDSVPFQLKATLADNVSSYTTYKVVFHDTLSGGLTYKGDAKVLSNNTDVTSNFTITENNGTLTISCDNVKEFGATDNSVITVEYTATLNGNAVIGSTGNTNKVKLEYSNNPNKSESGNNETGNTPEDTVVVFSYKTIINKVTKNPDYDPKVEGSEEYIPLTGAEFTLEKYIKKTDTWKAITVAKSDDGTTFTFSGLDDGDYRLTETKTPAGYNTIDPIEFTITATHGINKEHNKVELISLAGGDTTIEFTPNITDGSLSADVVNQAGSTLPETGGMGTTLLYIIGAILVVGAGVLLVARRRMHS